MVESGMNNNWLPELGVRDLLLPTDEQSEDQEETQEADRNPVSCDF